MQLPHVGQSQQLSKHATCLSSQGWHGSRASSNDIHHRSCQDPGIKHHYNASCHLEDACCTHVPAIKWHTMQAHIVHAPLPEEFGDILQSNNRLSNSASACKHVSANECTQMMNCSESQSIYSAAGCQPRYATKLQTHSMRSRFMEL